MENKKIDNYIKISKVLTVLTILIIVLGISYATFKTLYKGTKNGSITSGKVDIKIENETDEINISDTIPMTDSKRKKTIPYTFDVVNRGTIDGMYELYIKVDSTTTLPLTKVKYYLIREIDNVEEELNEPKTLSEIEENNSYKLDEVKEIKKNETISYKLYLWVDISATKEEASNKIFEASLSIESSQIYEEESILPRGYTELEYLESSGTQYIDPDLKTSDNMIITIVLSDNSRVTSDKEGFIFGVVNGTGARYPKSGGIRLGYNTGAWNTTTNISIYEKNTLYLSPEYSTYNNMIVPMAKGDIYSYIGIFAELYENRTIRNGGSCRIYSFSFKEYELLIRNLIPSLDPSGRPCMYDTVTKESFYNQGTGEFGYETLDGTYVAPTN